MAIQNNINQMLGTVAAATTMGKHIAQQEKSNQLQALSGANKLTEDLASTVDEIDKTRKEEKKLGKEAFKLRGKDPQGEIAKEKEELKDLDYGEKYDEFMKTPVASYEHSTPDEMQKYQELKDAYLNDPKYINSKKQEDLLRQSISNLEYDELKYKASMKRIGEQIAAKENQYKATRDRLTNLRKEAKIRNDMSKKYGVSINTNEYLTNEERQALGIINLKGGKR